MKYLLFLFLSSQLALAIEPMDNYYANDLIEAVDQAKASPHHYDYSNSYRYKRTTAQSIDLNRLNLKELDDTRLKTSKNNSQETNKIQLADTETKENAPNTILPQNFQEKMASLPQASLPKSSHYSSQQGTLSSSGIISNSTIKTTHRP